MLMSSAGMKAYLHSDSNHFTLKAKAKNTDDQPLQTATQGLC